MQKVTPAVIPPPAHNPMKKRDTIMNGQLGENAAKTRIHEYGLPT
jgi:hypothetical protein